MISYAIKWIEKKSFLKCSVICTSFSLNWFIIFSFSSLNWSFSSSALPKMSWIKDFAVYQCEFMQKIFIRYVGRKKNKRGELGIYFWALVEGGEGLEALRELQSFYTAPFLRLWKIHMFSASERYICLPIFSKSKKNKANIALPRIYVISCLKKSNIWVGNSNMNTSAVYVCKLRKLF